MMSSLILPGGAEATAENELSTVAAVKMKKMNVNLACIVVFVFWFLLSLLIRLWQFLDANVAVFHLVTVGFQTNAAGVREFQGVFQHFTVAGAVGDVVFHGDFDFIPILRPVFLELLVGSGDKVITALKLRLADESPCCGWRLPAPSW